MIRVLVVEDDKGIVAVLREFLTMHGYEVRAAYNGAEGLFELGGWRPDVVLLDLMMPVMDGWEFRRQQLAAQHPASVPTILLTASYLSDEELAPLSPTGVLRKPLDWDALLVAVAEAARSKPAA